MAPGWLHRKEPRQHGVGVCGGELVRCAIVCDVGFQGNELQGEILTDAKSWLGWDEPKCEEVMKMAQTNFDNIMGGSTKFLDRRGKCQSDCGFDSL